MDMSSLMHILLQIIIVGAICWLLYWLVGRLGIPEPFSKVALGIIAVVGVFFLINILLALGGGTPIVRWR